MLQVIETLTPLVFTIALGVILARKNFLSSAFFADLNQFVYWIGLPLLITKSLVCAQSFPSDTWLVFGLFFLASILLTLIAFSLRNWLSLNRRSLGAFLQGSFRGNLAFIAIPIIVFAMRKHSEKDLNEALTLAIFVFAPALIYYNVVSVVILMKCHAEDSKTSLKATFASILKNPLIISSITGVLLFLLPFKLPAVILQTMGYVGDISGPAALLCVGGSMAHTHLRGQWKAPLVATFFKVFLLPCLAFGLAWAFHLTSISIFVLLVLCSSPTAVASYVIVKAMKGDESLASSTIVMSTICSIVSLSIVVGFFTP
jgi:malate permease and related proteins